ncbi:MAG: DUF4330 family protein [Thermaerobacter sp.]|nr:DUF4330 family protein [Thermaerobacter sp.]
MRRRFNGFDILVAAIVVIGLLLLARRGLHHTGTLTVTHPVLFTVTSLPTTNAAAIVGHMSAGGTVTVSASGAFIPFGKLESVQVVPYYITASDGKGGVHKVVDPTQREVRFTVLGQSTLSGKTVEINGNPFLVGQESTFQEGGSQVIGIIGDEKVR